MKPPRIAMQPSSLAVLVGYDAALLAGLEAPSRRHLARVAEAWLLSCALLASPAAYAVWLVEHALWLSALVFAGVFALVLNLLRLAAAGGGAAAHAEETSVRGYRPALGASLVLALLALLFAQPAQLPLWRSELTPLVQAERAHLVREHRAAVEALGQRDDGAYAAQLARCDFLVLRLKAIWTKPTLALQLTGLYLVAVLLPALWARTAALSALREYHLARWRRDRRTIVQHERDAQRRVQEALSQFSTYRPRAGHFADAPFNTRVTSALLKVPRARAQAPATAAKARSGASRRLS